MLTSGTSMTQDICIEFDDVVAGYKDFMILNNLSFKVRRGTSTLLLGPNGAGKATVLKTLFGLLKPRQGRVRLTGAYISDGTPAALPPRCAHSVTQGRTLFARRRGVRHIVVGGSATAASRRSRTSSRRAGGAAVSPSRGGEAAELGMKYVDNRQVYSVQGLHGQLAPQ